MNGFIDHATRHPYLVAAAALMAVVAIVFELRQRGRGGATVTPNDAVRLVNSGALVVDVRDPKEYEIGHIIEARSVPAGELGGRAETLKKYKEKPVVVYCDNGFASAGAAQALRSQGFGKVVTLRGGLQSWRQENLPLVKGSVKKDGKQA